MPIDCAAEIQPFGQERFHTMDKVLMRHVFDMHNTMGRFFDERIYQDELARRFQNAGIEVQREVEIRLSHRDFVKSYYIDHLIERGMIYELKTSNSLNTEHQKQVIHYLLLAGLHHGKLINFRPTSVESRYVSTRLDRNDRMNFCLEGDLSPDNDGQSNSLKESLRGLIDEWGVFLEASLYREALLHFLNGPETGIQPVDISVNGRIAGSQKMCILNPTTAWHLSATRLHLPSYEAHIARLLSHTRLKQIHWINFNQRIITFKTLKK